MRGCAARRVWPPAATPIRSDVPSSVERRCSLGFRKGMGSRTRKTTALKHSMRVAGISQEARPASRGLRGSGRLPLTAPAGQADPESADSRGCSFHTGVNPASSSVCATPTYMSSSSSQSISHDRSCPINSAALLSGSHCASRSSSPAPFTTVSITDRTVSRSVATSSARLRCRGMGRPTGRMWTRQAAEGGVGESEEPDTPLSRED